MTRTNPAPANPAPDDASERRSRRPVVCYPPEALPKVDLSSRTIDVDRARLVATVRVAPRDAEIVRVARGHVFRIACVEGPQVGDLNVWNAGDLSERFYSGKTRALHGTHLGVGDQLWSGFPHLRPLATITRDTLDWYGFDADGLSVHDVIGTRCDPYTNALLTGASYDRCCHSNLTRALAAHAGMTVEEAEPFVHDVLNVFMCTGFSRQTGQYLMKASPVRPGDYLEFHAEMDLLVGLSACPGGDCGTEHSSDVAACHPLDVEVYRPAEPSGSPEAPANAPYRGRHGA